MGVHVVRLPDVGEGIAEAELVEWHVAVGDEVTAESVLADVMTDKATVEIASPVAGVVTFLTGEPGDVLAVGSDLVGIETDGGTARPDIPAPVAVDELPAPPAPETPTAAPTPTPTPPAEPPAPAAPATPKGPTQRPVAAPAVRQRARDLGVDLRLVHGSGPAGRITHADLDSFVDTGAATAPRRLAASDATHEIRLVGLRRKIAEKVAVSSSHIPHITYVDEVDVTAVEELRATLNTSAGDDDPKLTLLPFLARSIVRAVSEQPHLNSTFDDSTGVLTAYDAVHIGIATQTPNGLIVPVVRHAEALDIWETAREIARVSEAARTGTASRDELSGSTITVTSLGALGGIATTPIINHPEVAIVGVNKKQMRPVWDGQAFVPRQMMNLSSSFDHRVVDGWDAATFIQRIKALIETPALLFIERRAP
ncbi:MAG TPA: dihydrolipoamide acetyltransferase family protein [Ilumatobacteraceae bacterium]|nr:dihydrolipoamide acetyltransferase family protein [Ilumatobacteraceae bacterium]